MIQRPRCNNSTCRPSAFTLVELAAVIMIVGVLASIAVPRFAQALASRQVTAAAERVAADLANARHRARISSTTQRLVFNVASDSYTLVGMPDPDHPSQDYVVSLAEEPYRAQLASAAFGGEAEISFDLYGNPVDSSGNPSAGGSVGLRVGDRIRSVQLDGTTGRTTVTDLQVGPLPPVIPEEKPPVVAE